MRRDRGWEKHVADAIHLNALTDPAARPRPERCGLTERELARWDDISVGLANEINRELAEVAHTKRARRRWWARTAIAVGLLLIVGGAATYIIASVLTGGQQ